MTPRESARFAARLSISPASKTSPNNSHRSATIPLGRDFLIMPNTLRDLPQTLGALRQSKFSEDRIAARGVKDELRDNLICKLQRREPMFPGIIGYEDTVIPQVVNAVLSRHNFILLGLRGQAKTRLIRMLTGLLDEVTPYIAGCEIHDHPYKPICRRCRDLIAETGDRTHIAYLSA